MTVRFNISKDTPKLYDAMLALNLALSNSDLSKELIDLVKIRVSQINGCAFCVGMHVTEAMDDGMEEKQILLLPVWRESSAFNPKQKAALAWAETVSLLAGSGVSDSDYEAVSMHFSAQEVAELTVAIGAMNLWNRIGVSAKMPA